MFLTVEAHHPSSLHPSHLLPHQVSQWWCHIGKKASVTWVLLILHCLSGDPLSRVHGEKHLLKVSRLLAEASLTKHQHTGKTITDSCVWISPNLLIRASRLRFLPLSVHRASLGRNVCLDTPVNISFRRPWPQQQSFLTALVIREPQSLIMLLY